MRAWRAAFSGALLIGAATVGTTTATTAPAAAAEPPGIITTYAGTGVNGYNGDDRSATTAQLHFPRQVAFDPAGNLFIADGGNDRVRKVDVSGVITTVAGTGTPGYNGDDRLATTAQLNQPEAVFADGAGNVFIADTQNNRIRKVDPAGMITTIAGKSGPYNGDNQPAVNATLYSPRGVAVDATGNVYLSDTNNSRIRRVDAVSGTITTVAGNGTVIFNGDNIVATTAGISPYGLAVAIDGSIYYGDVTNQRVRKIDSAGFITTVAGTGLGGYNGDSKPATQAQLRTPRQVAIGSDGSLYIGDTGNQRTRKIDPVGTITTVAGTGSCPYNGDDQPAITANLCSSTGVAVDGSGNVFIADQGHSRIRRVSTPAVGNIEGTVRAAGVGAAYVHVLLYGGDPDADWHTIAYRVTDANGAYSFANLAPGRYRLRIIDYWGRYRNGWAGDSIVRTLADTIVVLSTSTETMDVALQPRPTGAIAVNVVAGPGAGTPRSNVWVLVIDQSSGAFVAGAMTNASGQAQISGLRAGQYAVRFIDLTWTYPAQWYENTPFFFTSTPITVGSTPLSITNHLQEA